MQKCQGRFRGFHKRIDAWIHADMWVEEDATSFMASYSKPLFGGHQTALKNSHFLFLGRQPLQHHLLPPAEGPHGRLFGLRGQDPPEVPQQELNFSKPWKAPFLTTIMEEMMHWKVPFMMRKIIWLSPTNQNQMEEFLCFIPCLKTITVTSLKGKSKL